MAPTFIYIPAPRPPPQSPKTNNRTLTLTDCMSELLPSTFDCTTCGPTAHYLEEEMDDGDVLARCPTCRAVLTTDETIISEHSDAGIDTTASLDDLDRTELDALSQATANAVKHEL